ncbi:hypothetical protein BDV3_002412 [Batrachochytrium dendrobatidis]
MSSEKQGKQTRSSTHDATLRGSQSTTAGTASKKKDQLKDKRSSLSAKASALSTLPAASSPETSFKKESPPKAHTKTSSKAIHADDSTESLGSLSDAVFKAESNVLLQQKPSLPIITEPLKSLISANHSFMPLMNTAGTLPLPFDSTILEGSGSSTTPVDASASSTSNTVAAATAKPGSAQRRGLPAPNRIIPAFLNKLYNMVSDPSTDEHIQWNEDGTSFLVSNPLSFSKVVLPRFFKHNNFTSFNRQLNMYGFHKVPSIEHGSLLASTQKEILEFSNKNFQKNRPDLLCFAVRRTNTQSDELVKDGTLDMNTVIHEISAIKRHQFTISAEIQKFQSENETLWNESIQLRERYTKQQETIDKILRFLASVFSSNKKPDVTTQKRRRIELPDVPLNNSPDSRVNTSNQKNSNGAAFQNFNDMTNNVYFSNLMGGNAGPIPVPNIETAFVPSISTFSNDKLSTMATTQHVDLNNDIPSTINLLQNPDFLASSLFGLTEGAGNLTGTPQLLNQLEKSSDRMATVNNSAQEVSEDIDMLQDRVYDIASAVAGLQQGQTHLGDWNMSDLISRNDPTLGGSHDEHDPLMELMKQQPDPMVSASSTISGQSSLDGSRPMHPTWPLPVQGTDLLGNELSSNDINRWQQPKEEHLNQINTNTIPEFDQFDELIELPLTDKSSMHSDEQTTNHNELDQDYFNTFFSTS